MSFYQRYSLERLLGDGETKTFRAKENETGRAVFLHLFNKSGMGVLAALQAKLVDAAGQPVWPLLELGDFSGNPYAVTEPIEPFTTLREWVGGLGKAPLGPGPVKAPQAAPPVPQAQTEGTPTQQFARLFDAPEAPAKPVRPVNVDDEFTRLFGSPSTAPGPVGPITRSQGPGEFTRAFQVPSSQSNQPAPPPAASSREPDEFEQLFGATTDPRFQSRPSFTPAPQPPSKSSPSPMPEHAPAPAWPPESPADAPTGNFTRLFGMGPSGEQINIEAEQARAARSAPESRPFKGPTEFTRVFGPQSKRIPGGGRAPAPPPPPMPGSGVGLNTSMFQTPFDPPGGTPKPAGPLSQTRTGPGVYTRTVSPVTTSQRTPGPATQFEAAPIQRKGWIVAAVIGGAVVLIVILVVVMMSMRK